jgi:hypothetical protein
VTLLLVEPSSKVTGRVPSSASDADAPKSSGVTVTVVEGRVGLHRCPRVMFGFATVSVGGVLGGGTFTMTALVWVSWRD